MKIQPISHLEGDHHPRLAMLLLILAGLAFPAVSRAQLDSPVQNIGVRPDILKDVGIDQKLNDQIPLDLTFRDERGAPVVLSKFFGQKPVIISLAYYTCPMLCTQVLNGLEQGLKNLSMDAGKQFNVLTISIDPSEGSALASAKHELYTGIYGHPGAAEGWHFLTGNEPQIHALASALGFRYAYDPETKQFAHASAIMILTPDGRISRYLYGIQFPSRDLRLALVEASEGKIGTPIDQVLLFCYHYDPVTGKYGLLISHVIKAAGLLTILAIGIMFLWLRRGEHYALPERKA